MGLPLAALLLEADGHEIVWAGICRKGAIGTRRLSRRADVAVMPDLERAAEIVRPRAPDLVVSWFWTTKVPRVFRETAPLAIGVHPSLLPRHRGPDPYFWAIDSGDAVTGVTAHVLEDEYDTGAMLGREELAVDPSWNAWTLAKRLDRPSLRLLRKTVRSYEKNCTLVQESQDDARATAAPQPTDDDLEIRWSWDAARIERRVRAAAPWPGAFTEIAGEVVTLLRVRPTDDFPRALDPGDAFVRKDGIAIVRAADRALELLAGRLENDGEDARLDREELAEIIRS